MSEYKRMKLSEARIVIEEFEELDEGKLDPAKSTSALVHEWGVGADDVKKNKDGTHRFYRGFFYKSGSSSGHHAKNISKGLESYGIKHDVVDHGTQDYKPFKGGASVRSQNHHWVDVKIHPGQKIDPEKDYKAVHEEVEELDELSKGTLASYVKKAATSAAIAGMEHGVKKAEQDEMDRMMNRHMSFSDKDKIRTIMKTNSRDVEIPREKAGKRIAGINRAVGKLAKEETEGCMLDTSMGGADQISASKTGEIYKKSSKQTTGPSPATGTSTHVTAGKDGEAYNTTGITKRVPAVESAVLDVMAKTFERRKMFEDASNIAIISPDQRQDWLNVYTGKMDVADYFNKYKV